MALYRDERRRLEALAIAIRRKAGPFALLDDEQKAWLAAWREDQPSFDYETMITTDDDSGEGLRSDIKRILYGEVPTILVTDTEAMAGEKLQRYLERKT